MINLQQKTQPPEAPLPGISLALLNALNERFPERCAHPSQSDREIWMYSGRRALVRFLNEEFNRQNENLLTRPNVHVQP